LTRDFDINAVAKLSLFDELPVENINLSEITISLAKASTVRRAIVEGHYSGVMPDACQEIYGAFLPNGVLVGVVLYGPGGSDKVLASILPGTTNQTGRELIRLWLHPNLQRNTASWLVSRTLKMLPPEVSLIVSFADSGQGHYGYVYQALNFSYLGMTNPGTRFVDTTGVEVTPRLANIYRMRRPEEFGDMSLQEIRDILGWTPVTNHSKHRYALGVGHNRKSTNRYLDSISQPYPKPTRIVDD
jgi:hypothetical protein